MEMKEDTHTHTHPSRQKNMQMSASKEEAWKLYPDDQALIS